MAQQEDRDVGDGVRGLAEPVMGRHLWDAIKVGTNSFIDDRNALEALCKAVPKELRGTMANKPTAKAAWDALKTRHIGVDRRPSRLLNLEAVSLEELVGWLKAVEERLDRGRGKGGGGSGGGGGGKEIDGKLYFTEEQVMACLVSHLNLNSDGSAGRGKAPVGSGKRRGGTDEWVSPGEEETVAATPAGPGSTMASPGGHAASPSAAPTPLGSTPSGSMPGESASSVAPTTMSSSRTPRVQGGLVPWQGELPPKDQVPVEFVSPTSVALETLDADDDEGLTHRFRIMDNLLYDDDELVADGDLLLAVDEEPTTYDEASVVKLGPTLTPMFHGCGMAQQEDRDVGDGVRGLAEPIMGRHLWDAIKVGTNSFIDDRNALEALCKAVPKELRGTMANKPTAKAAWDALKTRHIGVDRRPSRLLNLEAVSLEELVGWLKAVEERLDRGRGKGGGGSGGGGGGKEIDGKLYFTEEQVMACLVSHLNLNSDGSAGRGKAPVGSGKRRGGTDEWVSPGEEETVAATPAGPGSTMASPGGHAASPSAAPTPLGSTPSGSMPGESASSVAPTTMSSSRTPRVQGGLVPWQGELPPKDQVPVEFASPTSVALETLDADDDEGLTHRFRIMDNLLYDDDELVADGDLLLAVDEEPTTYDEASGVS
ncbi:unnamed protein product [Miscanthus lutarioriparius]|uniref:Uncharacterized protein n=1 Tax=Miscanthus lutarioriparius TaxID=422564 RepID=A0A811RXS2_9POAL|nr:unnamed protein product [Miscanthus lutarioriparius]